jgi:hypothetical protein
MPRLFSQGTVLHDPALDGGMGERHPPLCHPCFDMSRASGGGDRPAHAQEHELLREMGLLAAARHRRSPSLCLLSPRGRAYPTSIHMKIGDTTHRQGMQNSNGHPERWPSITHG